MTKIEKHALTVLLSRLREWRRVYSDGWAGDVKGLPGKLILAAIALEKERAAHRKGKRK